MVPFPSIQPADQHAGILRLVIRKSQPHGRRVHLPIPTVLVAVMQERLARYFHQEILKAPLTDHSSFEPAFPARSLSGSYIPPLSDSQAGEALQILHGSGRVRGGR